MAGDDEDNVTTDENGKYSISMYEGDYTLTVTKNHYVSQSKEIALTAAIPNTDFALAIDVLPPYSVTATDSEGSIAVNWEAPQPLNERKYDNGEAEGVYGYGENFTGSQVIGTKYMGETTVYELKWQTVNSIDNNITLMLLGTDYGGNPTGEVLFQAAVTTVDDEWNSRALRRTVHYR